MRKINLSAALVTSLALMNCVKKQFVAFEAPHAVMHIKSGAKVEILQEPLKKEMIMWDSSRLAQMPVEGLLRVTFKDTDYFYLQMNCPAELKCNGKKIYIPRNLTHAVNPTAMPFKNEYKEPPADASSARFVITESRQIQEYLQARDWYAAGVKKDLPMVFDQVILRANVPETSLLSVYGDLLYLARSYLDKEYAEKPSPDFVRMYPFYEELAKTQGANLAVGQSLFLRELRKDLQAEYETLLRRQLDDFPFAHASYKAMAAAFNRISAPQMLRGELFARIAKSSAFSVNVPSAAAPIAAPGGAALYAQENTENKPAAAAKVEVRPTVKNGLIVAYEAEGKKAEVQVPEYELVAYAHEKGISFQLGKDKTSAPLLEPVEESLFLKSGNPAEIQKFVKAIPEYKTIVAENDFDLALLRIAMKYGQGGINRKNGMFEYEIDLSKGRNFWIVLAAVKNRFGEDSDGKYSGKIPDKFAPYGDVSDRTKGQINWYQKYEKDSKLAQMGIKGKATYCQRMCEDVEVDMVCFDNREKVRVTFRPAAIFEKNADKDSYPSESRNVHADFAKTSNENDYRSCNSFFRLARTDQKFD